MPVKIVKKLFSIVRFLVTVVILTIVAVILVQRISNNTKTILGYRIFTVVTESMVPKYEVGDVLLVKEKEINQIQVGEDVAYLGKAGSFADKIVTHQVIDIEKNEAGKLIFHTKGIANDTEDPEIKGDQIYGTVQAKLQLMSFLNGIINNMYGMYFLIVIPLAVIFFTEMRGIKKDIENKKKEKEDTEKNREQQLKDETIEDKTENSQEGQKESKTENKQAIDKKIQKRKERRAKRRNKYE